VKKSSGDRSEVDKNIGEKRRQQFGKEAHLTMGGGQALQNERIQGRRYDPILQASGISGYAIARNWELEGLEWNLACNKETLCTYLAVKIGSASGKI